MAKRKYSPEIRAQALVLYSTGMSYRDISKLLGVKHAMTVYRWVQPEKAQYYTEYNAQYHQKNKEKYAKKYQDNREKIRQEQSEYYQQNRDRIAERRAEWYQQNRDYARQYRTRYRKQNPEKIRAGRSKRRADKRKATPPWFNSDHKQQCDALHAEAIRLEQETGTQHHVDHIYPITGKTRVKGKYQHTSCGLHVPWNLRVLPGPDNCKKTYKLPDPTIDPPTAW